MFDLKGITHFVQKGNNWFLLEYSYFLFLEKIQKQMEKKEMVKKQNNVIYNTF